MTTRFKRLSPFAFLFCVPLLASSCVFGSDDDDGDDVGDADDCRTECSDAHGGCVLDCDEADDACRLDCESEQSDCETECD